MASLELGGHAPFVVFADADLDLAAEKLTFSKLQNAGQTCIAANRVLVERPSARRAWPSGSWSGSAPCASATASSRASPWAR